jgi:hypothetical protein
MGWVLRSQLRCCSKFEILCQSVQNKMLRGFKKKFENF